MNVELFNNYPDVVTAAEVSEMLRINVKKVYKLVRDGEIPCIPKINTYRILKADVIRYVNNKKNERCSECLKISN